MSIRKNLYYSLFGTIEKRRLAYNYRKEIAVAHDRLKKNPQPELSAVENEEIDSFWKQFGIRLRDHSWYQFYYGLTGVRDPRYIPQELYFYTILPYYNNKRVRDAYKDKNAFDLFLPASFFPETVMKRIGGDFFDKNGNYMTDDPKDRKLVDCLMAEEEVIVKNAMDSGRGENVRKYTVRTEQDARSVLDAWPVKDYIVQKVIKQHPFFAQFNESSVNIIRINTWYHEGRVAISTPVIRFGMPGFATDCCFIDGEEVVHLLGLTEDGYLRDKVVNYRGEAKDARALFPQASGQVPCWNEIKAMITEGATKLKHFRLVGWDIAVTADGEPKVIEYNILAPSTYSSQVTDGPMWGEHTEALLAFLKDERNREKYVPKKNRWK